MTLATTIDTQQRAAEEVAAAATAGAGQLLRYRTLLNQQLARDASNMIPTALLTDAQVFDGIRTALTASMHTEREASDATQLRDRVRHLERQLKDAEEATAAEVVKSAVADAECRRLRELNNHLAKESGSKHVLYEIAAMPGHGIQCFMLVAPDTPDEHIAHQIVDHMRALGMQPKHVEPDAPKEAS